MIDWDQQLLISQISLDPMLDATGKALEYSFKHLKEVPDEVFDVAGLQELDLYCNALESPPESIGCLSQLQKPISAVTGS